MARKFLYIIAFLTFAIIATLVVLRVWSKELTALAFVPSGAFEAQPALVDNAYAQPGMWYARPGDGPGDTIARWQPSGTGKPEAAPPFAVFFVHPTSYLEKAHWNAPLDDPDSQDRARLFLRGMASPFAQAKEIWAPRYRQATVGAFLTQKPEAGKALDLAFGDVADAFDTFVASIPEKEPIVLAGHSQGSLHLLRLLEARVAGTPLANRIAAVYAAGWPVSIAHDLPALGLPACSGPDQSGCIMAWSSYAEPAEPADRLAAYAESPGLDGQPRGQSPILCTNPLTGGTKDAAPASANLGTLKPNDAMNDGELVPGAVSARCDDHGILLIGDPPEMGSFVLPGNDYHVYDIPLFWRNLQADATRRVKAWQAAR